MMVPRSDLSALWPDAAVRELQAGPANAVHFGHTVRHLAYENNAPCDTARRNHTRVQVDGEPFDAVIVATPPPSAARLLGTLVSANARSYPMPVPGLDQNQNSHRHRQGHSTPQDQSRWLGCLAAFNFLPIATVTLTLEHPWPDPAAMLMLDENPAHGHYGQWLFNHYHLNPRWKDRLAVVISDARQFAQADENTAVQGIVHQIRTQTAARRHALPLVREHKVIIEKRATFAAVPGLWRPENTTPWPGILVAGDWTNTGYPSVLEGAVRSGQNAARRLIENSRQRMPAAV
jgi:hypothetical protein